MEAGNRASPMIAAQAIAKPNELILAADPEIPGWCGMVVSVIMFPPLGRTERLIAKRMDRTGLDGSKNHPFGWCCRRTEMRDQLWT